MDIFALEYEVLKSTDEIIDVEVKVYEPNEFNVKNYSLGQWTHEHGMGVAIEVLKDRLKWFKDQGFYCTWKLTRTGIFWNRYADQVPLD